jgi:hypothetical protein
MIFVFALIAACSQASASPPANPASLGCAHPVVGEVDYDYSGKGIESPEEAVMGLLGNLSHLGVDPTKATGVTKSGDAYLVQFGDRYLVSASVIELPRGGWTPTHYAVCNQG